MAFLRNDAINRVNLHYGIQALAQGLHMHTSLEGGVSL
jgi:hypothetical protein